MNTGEMLTPAIVVPWLLIIVPEASASSLLRYNATLDEGRIECVYPISGQYALLQRVLYYGLLLFSIVSRKTPWLVAGALGAAMTYAGSAAVHATILAGISRDSLLDLDCLGIFAIVSVGSLVVTVFFHGSELLRESPARPVFQYWGLLMVVGTICAVVAMLRDYPSEERCTSTPSDATNTTEPILLTSTAQLGLMPFNCTYACFSTRQAFRETSDIRVIPAGTVSHRRFRLLSASICLSIFLGAVVSLYRLLVTPRYYTKDELTRILRSANKTLAKSDLLPKQRRYAKQRQSMAQKKLARGQKRGRPGVMTDLLSVACAVVIILNEIFIHIGDEIPASEPPYAVGQWGPWVAVFMALAGSAIVEYHRPAWDERQRILREEGVLAQGENAPSLFSLAWTRLERMAGKSPATGVDPGAEIVQWPEAAWRRGLPS
ncbi:hypothetical protein IFM58399_06126 [Aspergillus lentulus]|uniref:Uncharacterized protein n=1 Tax=Aspergillus lentulus TaxID=293939 RepID=A0ABQ1AL71_ASPLE|nr:uncharacterized protein IFM58399_06126 [Aspergillus lentulus]KAF4157454.1 hypothetical protein CNMCM6069_005548 [Aspergillus lentulus]GFF41030.1 hypothetical protein IFM58399_06126 [Aspergillus lentulus]GFF83930.1 hypothetical protein IFM60648_06861 [Aspergillus lentulus]GFF87322.1 hypothetical protein IFM47457_07455 [Aspergillus lentulus]GFG11865.1 hypothetical protein IFM61392_07117 [Aspergillus lentulus]